MIIRMLHGRLLLALLSIAILVGTTACKNDSRSREASVAQAQANTREAAFSVEGMTCASCNVTVKVAAEKVRGVKSARADSAQGRAWVTFDPTLTTTQTIAAAISETGYKATPLRSEEAAPRSSSRLEPWQPADEAFRGCEGGCGLRVTSATAGVVTQPGARAGQRTYCPVSGVVVEVQESTSRRDVDGQPIYFCCETCAQHFDGHRERMVAVRGLAASR